MQDIKIIRLDPQKCGQKRLHSWQTWPGYDRVMREYLAGKVVDYFHDQLDQKEIIARWKPSVPCLEIIDDGGAGITAEVVMVMIDEAYQKIGEIIALMKDELSKR